MVNNVLLFIDTESTVFKSTRITYDISFTIIEQAGIHDKFNKELRSRTISNNGKSVHKVFERNFIVDEFADFVPASKKHMYGYANYMYSPFDQIITCLKTACDVYKPDAIIGYNMQADFDAIKSTQGFLKSSPYIYSPNSRLSSSTLFKKNVCKAYDSAHKCDLMLYLTNHCPHFMEYHESFAHEHSLYTPNNFVSHKLIDMYRYSTHNPNIEQLHMGYYDNMYAIKCFEKSIKTDGVIHFPICCMSENNRKRKHMDDFNQSSSQRIVKHKWSPLPSWFQDQVDNSRCYKNESITDIRKFHPDFGGPNKPNAPYFRGEVSGSGIWPPSYITK